MAVEAVAVIPFYGEDLEPLIATVLSALDYVDRVVIADDASPVPVRSPAGRVSVVRQEINTGPGGAMNLGIATLHDDAIVCRLDCRDEFLPPKAEQIATTRLASFSQTLNPLTGEVRIPHSRWPTRMLTDNQFASSGTVFSVSTWRAVGGYDATLRWGEDWDFAIRVQRAVGWTYYPHCTAIHGEHPGGLSDVSSRPDLARLRDADIARVRERARR